MITETINKKCCLCYYHLDWAGGKSTTQNPTHSQNKPFLFLKYCLTKNLNYENGLN